jgi:hypothetical protein
MHQTNIDPNKQISAIEELIRVINVRIGLLEAQKEMLDTGKAEEIEAYNALKHACFFNKPRLVLEDFHSSVTIGCELTHKQLEIANKMLQLAQEKAVACDQFSRLPPQESTAIIIESLDKQLQSLVNEIDRLTDTIDLDTILLNINILDQVINGNL